MSLSNRDFQASFRILQILQASSYVAENVLDQLPGLFLLLNDEFRVLRANPMAARFLGVEPEDVLRCSLADLLGDHAVFATLRQRILDGRLDEQFQADLRSPEGGLHSFYWFVRGLRDAHGSVFYLVVAEDVTQLREYEQRLMRIYNVTPLGIFTLNDAGQIEKGYSHYSKTILGSTEDIAGSSFMDVIIRKTRLSHDEKMAYQRFLSLMGGPVDGVDLVAERLSSLCFFQMDPQCEDGKWLKISLKPIEDGGLFRELLVILEDQSEQVDAQRARLEAEQYERQGKALYEMAVRDPLTGLFNRLFVRDTVEQMYASFERGLVPGLSICMFDVDHFKKVNDTYGHQLGDEVLRMIGRLVRHTQRKNDVAIRWGGEEFIVLLVAPPDKAGIFAERLRVAVEAEHVDFKGQALGVTISLGVAGYRIGESFEQVLERADELLYASKRDGRNRSTIEALVYE